ncbi:MAG TPA: nuclear transport factor 2 family protein [Bacillota bacterium]|nr:nuclear transport factor 2 family protein [Bacillota bacterium]
MKLEERLEVKKVFSTYVDALESNDVALMESLFSENVILESTNYGNANGKKQVANKISWSGEPINYSRYKIFNFVCFTENGHACQSAVVTGLVGINDEDYFHYFNFGGYYLNDYVKENGKWKISHIRFNLDFEDGNTCFVRNWWKLIDYRYFEGNISYPIVSEIHAPWRVIENPESLGTDEEQVLDAYYRYSWGIDHADFEIFKSCIDSEFCFGNSILSNGKNQTETKEDMLANLIKFMKYKRFKEATMEHIWKIVSVDIQNGIAKVKSMRYEPNRMSTTKFNRLNMETDFYTGKFEYEFVKREGNDWKTGGWKMRLNNPKELKIFSETTHDKNKFF